MPSPITVTFPGGKRTTARVGEFTVETDQPVKDGGENSAPTPSDYFLVSIAACAGYYALAFCEKRDMDTSALSLSLDYDYDPKTKRMDPIRLVLTVPKDFPEKYEKAILRAMDQCFVKKHIMESPAFEMSLAR